MTTMIKKGVLAFLTAVLFSTFSFAAAQDRHNPFEIWVNKKWDYAAEGYDVTSYFKGDEESGLVATEGEPVKGDPQFSATIANGTYIFASQENLDKFKANPELYKPQYGGHCAYALGARGFFVHGDPEAWHVSDGKLYFNLKTSIQRKWLKKKDEYITAADPRWGEKFPTASPIAS